MSGFRRLLPCLIYVVPAAVVAFGFPRYFPALTPMNALLFGAMVGLDPWNSALRLGWHHAWILVQLANGALDALWVAVGLGVAAWLSR